MMNRHAPARPTESNTPIRIRTTIPAWGAGVALALSIAAGTPAIAQSPAPAGAEEPAAPQAATPGALQFNFHGVPLDTVLDYMSRAGGFTVVKKADVSGSVNMISAHPISRDEAVGLLDTILATKGYAAVRQGEKLLIVARDEARFYNLPVRAGSDPEAIPNSDEMVTQIMPIKHVQASQLIENIQPLLPDWATLTSNESSNALILTDTQSDIRRIAQIIESLDQVITEKLTVRVFPLDYADATDAADLVSQLFSDSGGGNNPFARMQRRFQRGRGRGGDNGGDSGGSVNGHVTAQADERTNSLVVVAPEELMTTIANLIDEIDHGENVDTVIQVFPLQHATATDMADSLSQVFDATTSGGGNNNRGRGRGRGRGRPTPQPTTTNEPEVRIVADERTNSLIVFAGREAMPRIATVVQQLDASDRLSKQVYVYKVDNADPAQVSSILQQMFGGSGGSRNNRNNNRNNNN